MLVEFDNVRQVKGEDERRLFKDDYFDLYVWYRDGRPTGFQLCYDKGSRERAFMWTESHGYSHYDIDSGENSGEVKRTPVFSSAGAPIVADLMSRFLSAVYNLDQDTRDFVIDKMKNYPLESQTNSIKHS